MGLTKIADAGIAVSDDVSVRTLGKFAKTLGALTAAGAASSATGQVFSGPDPIYLLLQRTTFGFTQADYALAQQMGFQGYLEWQLDHFGVDDSALDDRLKPLYLIGHEAYSLWTLPAGSPSYVGRLQDATLIRAVFSRRQLFEKMVEFWSDHFSIDINKSTAMKVVDDREVVRVYALSTFAEILRASAHSPAMLFYLDNQTSNATTPNQNYARELMELHTMGVDSGYTQTDVIEVAKCFSGWGLYGSNNKRWGKFLFTSSRHNNGPKVVLGQTIPSGGGMNDGETVVNILAAHPSTARFIATKLVRRFLADDPPETVVSAVESVFLSSGGDIKQMLRTILTPENLVTHAQPRFKRPFHLIASILRASGAAVTNMAASKNQLTGMGHLPFRWAPPNGYPDQMGYWSGLVLPRWNYAFSLLNGNISGATVNASALFSGLTTNTAIANKINSILTNGHMAAEDLSAVTAYMSPTELDINKIREALAIGMCSPSFQMY